MKWKRSFCTSLTSEIVIEDAVEEIIKFSVLGTNEQSISCLNVLGTHRKNSPLKCSKGSCQHTHILACLLEWNNLLKCKNFINQNIKMIFGYDKVMIQFPNWIVYSVLTIPVNNITPSSSIK